LAEELKIHSGRRRGRTLVPELKASSRHLFKAYLSLSEAVRDKQAISPAAEWFVDNFHIVEDQIREIRKALPANYYRELPKLAGGSLEGYPRLYAIVLAIIGHTDSRLDVETLRRFIQAFQEVAPLTIGELWAIPITLRIALVEHLKPLTEDIVRSRQEREEGNHLADRLLAHAALADATDAELVEMLSSELARPESFKRAFVVQLIQRLRDQDPNVEPAFEWLEAQLLAHHQTHALQVIQLEHNEQATTQVTVLNIITSMRLLSTLDWRDFFESVSLVDPLLAHDPVGVYARMDFATRDRYRHAIERIARGSKKTETRNELVVAQTAVRLASEDQTHIGRFLIGPDLRRLEMSCHYRPKLRERAMRACLRFPTFVYLGTLGVLTLLISIPVMLSLLRHGVGAIVTAALAVPGLILASELAVGFLNHYVPLFFKPKPLPRMETEHGLPGDAKTIVVIPTLLIRESVVLDLLESLHVHFLGNQDPNLYFALLSDYPDAASERMPHDQSLLDLASRGIDELNERYMGGAEKRFHLFHRKRLWNASEGKYLGWERKRGKIHEFNRLLRGAKDTSFERATADPALLAEIKYVITLDSDTRLPRDAAFELVATILHPLNQPRLDRIAGRVTEGYGILQPRISVELASNRQSRFAQIFSGTIGLDPYTTAVSDIYQDLFEEGSFTGKGLYVVDAFEAALTERVPENRLLSHDLFEGSFARSALVTDVELYDDFPSTYSAYSKRQHRWTRGDWQIAQWTLPHAPTARERRAINPLSLISRWKVFDNLRRSVVPPAMMVWLVVAWSRLPGSPFFWTLPVIVILSFPLYGPVSRSLLFRRRGMPWIGYFREVGTQVYTQLEQSALTGAFLARQAWNQIDAIVRTFYRLTISRRDLLEWVSFSQVEQLRGQAASRWAAIGAGPVIAVAIFAILIAVRPEALWVATPFLIAWGANPWLERWLAHEARRPDESALGDGEVRDYRRYARRTWHYFETFVGSEDHWLAPDNFQEDPVPVVAHRTSPTNIGLQLLATASAHDFGYVGRFELVDRLEKTFETLSRLKRMKGHFFNWYDTLTLEPLKPQYISTVDSGNLAAHLLTLKQACLEYQKRPLQDLASRNREQTGLEDTLHELQSELAEVKSVPLSSGATTLHHLETSLELIFRLSDEADWSAYLEAVRAGLGDFEDHLNALAVENLRGLFDRTRVWLVAAQRQAYEFQRDHELLTRGGQGPSLALRLQSLMDRCDSFALNMDFAFLFDPLRKLFVIGFNATDMRRDTSYYDLLASESRLASFVAIAKGDVPQEHWFRLGRKLTPTLGGQALISWTATMFEYLMPLLVMRNYRNTLLDRTYSGVIHRQIEYGRQHRIPWGVSESGYNARDLQLNYQYAPFGVPGLGLKRGLSDDVVTSPYSTFLAAQLVPRLAHLNLKRLEEQNVFASFGFYESLDYTPERVPKNQKFVILRSFMAHHQGMSLVSIGNLLMNNIMQSRFHADPLIQATHRLLQEKIPREVTIAKPRAEEVRSEGFFGSWSVARPRQYTKVNVPSRTQLLSNGTYTVMITAAGSGYSRCGPLAVTRWREDSTRDHWGQFYYVRNRTSGAIWSVGHQPLGVAADHYEATFNEDRAELLRRDGSITTHTEVIVSTEDNVELRRVTLTNSSRQAQELEVTSFMECVFARPADDAAHPAFSNLFVETEYLERPSALLATRRRRSQGEAQVHGFHVVVTEGRTAGPVQYETDRSRFLGRGRTPQNPQVVGEDHALSKTTGPVLDPIFSLRQGVIVGPGETAHLTFSTGVAASREDALALAAKYHDVQIFAREAEVGWIKAHVQLRHLNLPISKANLYQRLAGRILYSDPSLRPRSHVLTLNTQTQSRLWAFGISGDIPIVLSRISDEKDMAMVRELLHAHEYLRLKGLAFDLVILNERAHSYLQTLQDELTRQIRMSGSQVLLDRPGGIFLRRADLLPNEDVILLKSVARVVLNSEKGSLEEQIQRSPPATDLPETLAPALTSNPPAWVQAPQIPKLTFFNGLGGFADGGRQYVIVLKDAQWTPAPWINVIANALDFGFIISESGSGYTWSVNSRENRLTPWSNDPVADPPGEAIYIRDEETGEYWSPTPLPIRGPETYVIKHGQGFTEFNHESHGISQSLTLFVPLDGEVKIAYLRLTNPGRGRRVLSVTSYAEWVLGSQRPFSAPHVITSLDSASGVVLAWNRFNAEFAPRVAFAHMSENARTIAGDRGEFLGRNGAPSRPAAMERVGLSGSVGGGMDPCTAIQARITLEPGEERVVVILLGQCATAAEAIQTARRFESPHAARLALGEVIAYWDQTLSTIEIKTPDEAMNTLVNRWLLYQTQACRVWARSAFYQSGGAFGFRDQLQDVMALIYSEPQIARKQILTASARQFPEGDVQHWWHPPTGRGVRTRFSDDLVWLPFVTSFYVTVTGDLSILSEVVPFIEAPQLEPGHDDAYRQPEVSSETGTLLEHCARTLDRSLKTGVHGLPLMGSGDWNDGMNRVGNQGRGESVWMGWFLHDTISRFLPHCGGLLPERVAKYRAHLPALVQALEENAWDGDWYRRAYFDDGTPLGSAANQECRIDSIAQSWAVLSGAGDPKRAVQAMSAVSEQLVHRGDQLIKLFVPPFDQDGALDPGYIKGYLPGVRENGGQYTHAAIWTLMAFAKLGDGDRAAELFSLLNPIHHTLNRADLQRYKVEPYVIAADVYGHAPHVGRGGWTWYTGSASWMYRAAVETILGFELRGDRLRINPKIPSSWPGFELSYRRETTKYQIRVTRNATPSTKLDGVLLGGPDIPIVNDGKSHQVEITL